MSPSPDIENLLRQKQMMDQFNQITSQGTGAAMLGGGANINQFNTPAAPTMQPQSQKGGGLFSSFIPGLNAVEGAKSSMDRAIQNKMSDMLSPKDPSVHALSYEQAQDPSQRPTLVRAPGSTQQLQIGPNNQLMLGPQPQFSPARYTPGMLGQ